MSQVSNFKGKKAISFSTAFIIIVCIVAYSCKKQNQQPLTSLPATSMEKSTWQDQLKFAKSSENILKKTASNWLIFNIWVN